MGTILQVLRTVVRSVTPIAILDSYRTIRYGQTWYDPQGQPVHKVFTEVYRRHLWGEGQDKIPFCSGHGSDKEVAEPYVQGVKQFIDTHGITSVVDLGCGDFRVGSCLVRPRLFYHGVDIVKDLIYSNSKRYSSANIQFSCRDVINDELPISDLCLIRQVLQHLSNDQVARILERCEQYPYVIVTEHLPDPTKPWTPNLDIHHGSNTRVDRGSGLYLDLPPFNRPIASVLTEVKLENNTIIRSVLLVNDKTKSRTDPRLA
jgi:hypothetical protein